MILGRSDDVGGYKHKSANCRKQLELLLIAVVGTFLWEVLTVFRGLKDVVHQMRPVIILVRPVIHLSVARVSG